MRPDDLEFIIAQYADGTLDARRSADLEAVFRRDAAARAMLESYRTIDGALAGVVAAQPAPEVAWDRLGDLISQQVSTLAASAALGDDTEESISRLSSGDLSPAESPALQSTLATNPRGRLVLSEYVSLDRAFEAARSQPMPQIRWERFAQHMLSAIDRVEDASAEALRIGPDRGQSAETSGVLGRIGNFFAQPRRMALAASVLVVASLSVHLVNRGGGGVQSPSNPGLVAPTPGGGPGAVATVTPPTPTLDIRVGPSFEPGGSTVTSITVGPPTGPGFDLTALADWARQSQSIIGKATTRPEDKATTEPADVPDPGTLFNE